MLNKELQFAALVNANRIALIRFLLAIVAFIEQKVKDLLIPQLPRLTNQVNKFKPITDDFTDDLNNVMNAIQLALGKQFDEQQIARKMSGDVSNFQSKWFQRTIKHVLGVDIFLSQPWLRDHLGAWIATNTDLIKNLQDKALSDIKYQVQAGFTQGLRHEEIAKNIMGRIGVTKSRAKLIARDQTSKLNSQLNQLKQQQVGISKYIWQTAMDERVRPSHRDKQGKTFSWDNPPADTGHPGQDVNCRCIALPVFDEKLFS
jgi:SPP1 gp7 family putative phage head morphogenesis protein